MISTRFLTKLIDTNVRRRILLLIEQLILLSIGSACCLLCPFVECASAQDYLTSTGAPQFAAPFPAEDGSVDAASGNLHLEIPLGSFPQRGGTVLRPRFMYDSHNVWAITTDAYGYIWSDIYPPSGFGYGGWTASEGATQGQKANPSATNCYSDLEIADTSGTQRWFHVNVNGFLSGCPSTGSAYASDSSGYLLKVTGVGEDGYCLGGSVYAPDGTVVWQQSAAANCLDGRLGQLVAEDSNGNEVTATSTLPDALGGIPLQDTLGRTVVTCPGYSYCSTVTNSEGATSTYSLTFVNVPVQTKFGEPNVQECAAIGYACMLPVLQSIGLPDGTSYTFTYDCYEPTVSACNSPSGQTAYYGLMTSMTLPTGGTVQYSYITYKDPKGGYSRWLSSKTSAGETWTFTPSVTSSTTQKVTVVRPDQSKEVIALTVDNGSWPTQLLSYDTDGVTLLSTINNTWDFSIACTLAICSGQGHQDVRLLSTSTTLPIPGGSITKQTKYTYDTPQTGNLTAVKEWKYQSGTSPTFSSVPDRATYTTYATIGTNNDINRPKSITVCNNVGTNSSCTGGGTPVAQTTITYDAYGTNGSLALAVANGFTNHDDTNFGTAYTARGNATQISKWVSGSTVLTTAISYDTTGQIVRVLDPNQNATSYSYTDMFYDDNGANPPATHSGAAKTNAYVTSVTDAIGSTSGGYYYGSGRPALVTDYDAVTTYAHYVDPFDRSTETDYPIGWALNYTMYRYRADRD